MLTKRQMSLKIFQVIW